MLEFSWFLCSILYSFVYTGIYKKYACNNKIQITFKSFAIILIAATTMYLFKYFNIGAIQPFLTITLFFLTFKLMYKKEFIFTLIGSAYIFVIFCLSELFYGLFITFILDVSENFLNNPLNYFISNIIILLITIVLFNLKIVKNIMFSFLKWRNNKESKSMVIFVLMALCVFCFPLYNIFVHSLPNSILAFLVSFSIAVFSFVILFFKEKNYNNKIVLEYEQLLNYVTTYEKTIEEKSKNQHEYKNQLIIIKGMIENKNKKASDYIDDILKNENNDPNLEMLRRLQYLPQGGLKGLIYYKIEEMISKKIDVYVSISSKFNTKIVSQIINDNLHNLSKIIGVYLDNAIEAVSNCENKYIIIEAEIENNKIYFSFSNTYLGNIDLSKIDKEGYTTKGTGKGYGLALVKDIINSNDLFEQKREINGPYYVQKLYIKK